jgi:hypothetical protein
MCDYSLHNVASRPAKVGDKLVTTKFDFLARGFAAIEEPNVAVCLLPGTEVAFEKEVERDHAFDRLLVTRLCEGQRATVLQLPASPRVTREAREQMHASPVA